MLPDDLIVPTEPPIGSPRKRICDSSLHDNSFLVEGVRELKDCTPIWNIFILNEAKESECFVKLNEALGQFLSEKENRCWE